MHHISRMVGAALVLTVASVLGAATVSAAAPTADQNDPIVSGCSRDGYQVLDGLTGDISSSGNTGAIGTIRLMYSPHCNKNWAEADGIPAGIEVKILVWNAQGSQEHETWFTTPSSTWGWTDMVYGGVSAGASIDAGVDGPYYLHQSGATPPDDMGL